MGTETREVLIAPNHKNVLVIRSRLESTFALDQFMGLAKKMSETDFISWCATIFGFEPVDKLGPAYKRLRKDLISGGFKNPPIEISGTRLEGHEGAYDFKQNIIKVFVGLPKKAKDDPETAWKLLIVLLEEFGHHIDWVVRNQYSDVKGDAAMDEGARYAYALIYLDYANTQKAHFADYYFGVKKTELQADYTGFNEAVQKYLSPERRESEEKSESMEFFAAGLKQGSCSYTHKKIEYILGKSGFLPEDLNEIYFGNWMRDYSQIVDPKLVRDPKIPKPSLKDGFSRDALTKVVDYMARLSFGEDKDSNGKRKCLVTKERLGLYRPEEHIDNPKGIKNAKNIDPDFRGDCTDAELEVNPNNWLKKYIATPGSWETSAGFVKKRLERAVQAGNNSEGHLHLGAALHILEDYYAHSNFVEVALIELGHKVYPWSKKMSNGHYPVVTGSFGGADTVASIVIEIAQMMEEMIDCNNKKRGKGLELGLILLGDIDLKWRANLDAIITVWEKLAQHPYYRHPAMLLCRSITRYMRYVRIFFGYLAQQVGNVIDDAQSRFADDAENPTHSQLAKDHDDHPLHVLSSKCAEELSYTIGKAMLETWKGKMTASELYLKALRYFSHPAKIEHEDQKRIMEIISRWGKDSSNKPKIERAASKDFIQYQSRRYKEKLKYLGELSRKYAGKESSISKLFEWLEKEGKS